MKNKGTNEEVPMGFCRQGEADVGTMSLILKASLCPSRFGVLGSPAEGGMLIGTRVGRMLLAPCIPADALGLVPGGNRGWQLG